MVKNISAFKDSGVHLQKWIAQKEKMMAVLGPISTEKEMNQNQVEQVKVSNGFRIVCSLDLLIPNACTYTCAYTYIKWNS